MKSHHQRVKLLYNILYNDKVKYQDKIGVVKEATRQFAKVLFEGDKKVTMLPIDALEKIND